MLARCLSSLQIAGNECGYPCELIVVDDASRDGSARLVRERFPKARLVVNPKNLGFARTINRGAGMARGTILVLANNDIVADAGFLRELAKWFFKRGEDLPKGCLGDRLFAISARTVRWYDGEPNQLCMGAVWRGGRLTPAYSTPKAATPCLFVQAGAAAYDLALFRQLGGLSTLYEPGYWEDYDLSWRAARRGWFSLYDPASFAMHHGGGSMTRRYGADGVAAMKVRNHILFELANLSSPRLALEWIARLPLQVSRDRRFARAFLEAVARFPRAARQRLMESGPHSDASLLASYRDFTPSF